MAVEQSRGDVAYGGQQGGMGEQSYTDQAAGYMRHSYGEMQQCVAENPMTSTLTAFGVGLGVGILLGITLGSESRPQPRHWYDLGSADEFRRRVVEAVASALPESISKRMT